MNWNIQDSTMIESIFFGFVLWNELDEGTISYCQWVFLLIYLCNKMSWLRGAGIAGPHHWNLETWIIARTHTHWEIRQFPTSQLLRPRNHEAGGQVVSGVLVVAKLGINCAISQWVWVLVFIPWPMGMGVTGCWEIAHILTSFFFTDFYTGHGIKASCDYLVIFSCKMYCPW